MAATLKGSPGGGVVESTYRDVTSVGRRPWYASRRPSWSSGFVWPCAPGYGRSSTCAPPPSPWAAEEEEGMVALALVLSIAISSCSGESECDPASGWERINRAFLGADRRSGAQGSSTPGMLGGFFHERAWTDRED